MKSQVKIFLLGFSPLEKATFESFFKLVGREGPLYQIVSEVAQAHVLMVNSDNLVAVQWADQSVWPPQKALFIGAADPLGRWPAAPKPVKLTTVLGLLNLLMMGDRRVLEQPALASAEIAERRDSAGIVNSGFVAPNFMGFGEALNPVSVAQYYDDILVVDDNDISLKFMQNRLTRYGFRAEQAKTRDEALTQVATENYKFVFIEVMTSGLDSYQVCRAIKHRKYTSAKAPIVVMLASRGGNIDKIRGGLSGCDAYLTKPLNEAELLKVLSKYDEQVARSFSDTKLGSSGIGMIHSNR